MERPAQIYDEGGGNGDELQHMRLPPNADLWPDLHGRGRPTINGLPGGHQSWQVPTQKNDSMEYTQRLTQVWRVVVAWYISILFFYLHILSFFSIHFGSLAQLSYGSGNEA